MQNGPRSSLMGTGGAVWWKSEYNKSCETVPLRDFQFINWKCYKFPASYCTVEWARGRDLLFLFAFHAWKSWDHVMSKVIFWFEKCGHLYLVWLSPRAWLHAGAKQVPLLRICGAPPRQAQHVPYRTQRSHPAKLHACNLVVPLLKGTVSQELRHRLLYIIRKLFSRPIVALHQIFILSKGQSAINKKPFSVS